MQDTASASRHRDYRSCLFLSWGFFISSWFLLYHLTGRSVQLRFIFSAAASQSAEPRKSDLISSKAPVSFSPLKCMACPVSQITNMTLPPLEEHPDFRLFWPWKNMKRVALPMHEPLEISVVSSQPVPVKPLNNDSMSIFLWLKTRGGQILTAEVAERRNSTSFSGFVQLQDPGIYEVHALVILLSGTQRTFNLTQAGGSPGVLRAARNQEINRSSQRWAEKRRCQLGVDQVKGRWMQIPKASECNFGCARDRWYYVSTNCHWHVHSPREIHEMTRFLPPTEPLWLVMVGTSITRGSFQSLVDSLVPEAWELTAGEKNVPGVGTSVKCWGWLDFQVGGLRLSFQDFRLVNYRVDQVEVAFKRMKRLLSEGPDLLVIEIQGFEKRRAQWANIFQSVLLRHFDQKPKAKVILKLRHNHPSIMCRSCMTWGSSKSWNRTVETFMSSLPASLRSSAIGKLIAIDESPVSLPLFLDFEYTVQSHGSSSHWHRYDFGKTKGRKVFGTAADVWGHLYLTELLQQVNNKPLQGKSKAKNEKSPHSVAGCAQCPTSRRFDSSMQGFRAVPENVTYTLTAAQDLPLIGSWRNLTMQSCGQLVVRNDV